MGNSTGPSSRTIRPASKKTQRERTIALFSENPHALFSENMTNTQKMKNEQKNKTKIEKNNKKRQKRRDGSENIHFFLVNRVEKIIHIVDLMS